MLCWLYLENTLQIQFRMMLTLSHQFSCQNYLPLPPRNLPLLYFIWYLFLQGHFYAESPRNLMEIEAAPSKGFPSELKSNPGLCCGLDGSALSLSATPSLSRSSPFSSSSTLSTFLPQALNSVLCAKNAFPCTSAQPNPLLLSGHCSASTLKEPWLLTP